VAAVGLVVGVLALHPVSAKAGGVFTVRLTPVDAADPTFGVAVRVPL
jgi:hypothetical protein